MKEKDPCRNCGTPLIKRKGGKRIKPKQWYYFEYYFWCTGCRRMYTRESEKRFVEERRGVIQNREGEL